MARYEVIGELGKGANGEVKLIQNPLTKKLRALKLVPLGDTRPPDLAEAQITAQLPRHIHVVEVFDAYVHDEVLHLEMEYVRGISLKQRLAEAGALPIDEALTLFAQLMLGLEHAHTRNVGHLDIKPANLLIGEDGVLKITDWGSAQTLGTTDAKQASSTYPYAPPEFFAETPDMGRTADLWATGVVLYEMLTGTPPFRVVEISQRGNPFSWKALIQAGTFPSLVEQLSDERTERLQALVSRCLSPKATRFSYPSEVLEFLKQNGLYVLPLSEADYIAIDAFQAAINRLQDYLETSLAPYDWLTQLPRPNERPALAKLIYEWGRRNPRERNIVQELKDFRLYRNDLVHGPQECRQYRTVPHVEEIARLENLVEEITGTTFPRFVLPAKPEKIVVIVPPKLEVQPPQPKEVQPPQPIIDEPSTIKVVMEKFKAPLTLAAYKAQMVTIPTVSSMPVFRMGRTPVTVGMWQEYCREIGKDLPPLPDYPVWKDGWNGVQDHPMVNVSWNDARAYADWARLVLPTEAQWEFAASSGDGRIYPWGNAWDASKCHYSKVTWGDTGGTATVGSYPASHFGLYDMTGNVWEWCSHGSDSKIRYLKGGSWYDSYTVYFRCVDRGRYLPGDRICYIGFRLSSPAPP